MNQSNEGIGCFAAYYVDGECFQKFVWFVFSSANNSTVYSSTVLACEVFEFHELFQGSSIIGFLKRPMNLLRTQKITIETTLFIVDHSHYLLL